MLTQSELSGIEDINSRPKLKSKKENIKNLLNKANIRKPNNLKNSWPFMNLYNWLTKLFLIVIMGMS
jgi:mRNA-degrading endonuclease HigB of HigAB toxin-antitoxin module